MKSLKNLWKEVADELATWCCTSATLDYNKLEVRIENEGLSFLTISLPAFGKDFERSLERGFVDSSVFVGFARRRGPLPLFLGGFLSQVFDPSSGLLLDVPSVDCIFAVRQLTLMFGKILLECSEERTRGAMRKYIECEQDVRSAEADLSPEGLKAFQEVAALLWSDTFSSMDQLIYDGGLKPKHGPGATADKLKGNLKFDQLEWPRRLEEVFPYGDYALPNWRYYYRLDHTVHPEPEAERPVKVITVPKTLKTPRIIAVEPTCMQYMQQAILNPLVEKLESKVIAPNRRDNLAYSFIGFDDQTPNRDLSRLGSKLGHLATLDLSEASDRVSAKHVADLLWRWPHLREAVFATRSTKASVPGHGVIPLAKFASMGSALCFPFEAIVFTTLVFLGIQDGLSKPLTRKDVKSFRGKVRVYGDDIIVPVEHVRNVISRLESFGYKVNESKSFWNGKFRESCGADSYAGEDVTPVRVRRVLPSSRSDVQEVISAVELANHLYRRGLWRSSAVLNDYIAKLIGYLPVVGEFAPVLGRFSFQGYITERMDPHLHRPLVKGWVVSTKPPSSVATGEGSLLKCLLKDSDEPFADARHLERQGRPQSVNIKLRWMPPY